MNLFKNLFSKKKKQTPPTAVEAEKEEVEEQMELTEAQLLQLAKDFNAACQQAIPRYLSLPGAQVDLELKNEAGKPCGFAEAYPKVFEQWRAIESVWDQRTVIYNMLDQLLGTKLDVWQRILRLIDDRFAEKALEEVDKADDLARSKADYWAAAAKTYLVFTNYSEAERCLERCLALQQEHPLGQVLLADLYFVTDRAAGAQQLYQKTLQNSHFAKQQQERKISFQEVVGFEHNVLHSPMYAAAWLHENPHVNVENWEEIAPEFYWSPHFRSQHAYYLLQKDQPLQGLAKLLALTKEMPWYKEAVLNSHRLLRQMEAEKALAHEMSRISKLILDKGWLDELHRDS